MSIARSTTSGSEPVAVAEPVAVEDAIAPRRRFLGGAAAAIAAPWLAGHARAADVERFPLGVASGQPGSERVVLWTRVMGESLPERLVVRWEVGADEALRK